MSELKAGVIVTPHDEGMCFDRGSDVMAVTERETEFYLKSEADKVIAELKAENERLRGESCKLTDGCLRLKQCRKEKANIADELRHSNRKRCLAEAKVCLLRHQRYERYLSYRANCVGLPTFERWQFLKNHYEKWYKRWLALAGEPTWAKFLQLIHKEVK